MTRKLLHLLLLLQGALELCETEQQLNKDQAFQMLQDLKQEARPEVFNAVWTKMQNWGFDFKGLVLDGVPVVDPRRMVELQSAKPVQTIGWQAPSKAEAQRTEAGTLGSQSGAATTDGSSEVQTPPGQDDQAKKSATGEQDSTDPAKPRSGSVQPENILFMNFDCRVICCFSCKL